MLRTFIKYLILQNVSNFFKNTFDVSNLFKIPLVADFSADATFLDVRKTWHSRTFVFLFFVRILFLFFSLLRRQGQDLELV